MNLRRMDTPENRAFWASVDRAKDEWEQTRPAWSRELEERRECQHGHKQYTLGCVSCVLLYQRQIL